MAKPQASSAMAELSYSQAGVDTAEGARAVEAIRAAVNSTYTPGVIGDIGGFGGLFSATTFQNMKEPLLVSATDGVGTKLELAKRLQKHDSVGIDLVAMCVNDIVVTGARPLFFLDYLAVGQLRAEFAAEVVEGIANGCRQAGAALIGGEMAEHPGVMADGDYDLAGFAVGVVDRAQMIGSERVQAGDVVIGLGSSGLHSNGYSLVRRALTDKLSDAELASLTLPSGALLGEALLQPTRIYVARLLAARAAGLPIHAAAHITGGGITENLNRALPDNLDAIIDWGSWPLPEVIECVCDAADLSLTEALKTFNMGIGMALIVGADGAEAALNYFDGLLPVWRIGKIVSGSGVVTYRGLAGDA